MERSEVNRILQNLGLEQYIDTFKENQINDVSLESIGREDLAEVVPAVGHRAMIWSELSKLKTGSVYVCFSCSKGFVRLKELASHLTVVHKLTGDSEYRCNVCERLFNRKSYLQHLRNSFQVHRQFDRGLENDIIFKPEVVELENNNYGETLIDKNGSDSFTEELDKIEKCVMKLMCSIMKSGKVPISTADSIIANVKVVMNTTVEKIVNFITNVINTDTPKEDMLIKITKLKSMRSMLDKFDTRYKLDKFLIENQFIVMPNEIVLDTDISFPSTLLTGQMQKYKAITMQYVPMKNTILHLLNSPGFFQILEMNKSYNSEVYSNFREGKLFDNGAFPKNTIFINVYYDDAEIANPLGSKSGKHKLANFYFTILDMPQYMLSSIDNVFLLASLKTVDLKTSSVNSVLNQVVKELKDLWSNGINFNYNGQDLNFKVALAQVSGDNLGLHTLLGFTEGFTANYPCRRCKLHKNECRKATTECREKLRNLDNYDEDVAAEDFPLTGINFESILNELPYLHVTQIYVFDIMHDILEGVAPDLLLNTINYFIKKKILTLDKLNHRLESFDYGRGYKTTKPSQIKYSFLKGDGKIGQNAAQTLCLMLNFPLLLGDLVLPTDHVWSLFLLFREIFLVVLSDFISIGGVMYLDSIISEFLCLYQSTFEKTLKPKHHHLTHYASSIEQIGPLRHFWSMPFEAKHKFFKTAAHAACNFKNVAKTLAYRHQLSLCFKLQSRSSFTPVSIEYKDRIHGEIENEVYSKLINEKFNIDPGENVRTTSKISCNGCDFEIGCIVVIKYCSIYPIFGRIRMILTVEDTCSFLVSMLQGELNLHYSSFVITETNEHQIIDIHEIAHYQPVYALRSFEHNDLRLYVNLAFKRV